ncbi:PREDICTED: probable palmitoyltransferase ZDHHC20 [Dipodomys ordii]|uniref:Palmitoyltransferase n=1 Tax=Dipodomys ordii TaxID=10020 RepID=A0A1S3EW06_DIPOR|nr:PREDICTED: probable palmitoyltransferase ZDHHC20 [Dipodomys ordii]
MAPWTLWRGCQRVVGWVPVLFIFFVVVWSYYAYVVKLCVFTISRKTVVYLVAFHLFFVMFVWSYGMTIFTTPATPSKELFILKIKPYHQNTSICTSFSIFFYLFHVAIRYCEKCQLIKPDRAHHCSACDTCILKMDHHCPWVNNCVGFSNYKFFLLFLLYSLLYCLFVATTVLEYFIKFWTNELADPHVKFHVLFLFFVSAMFFISILSLFSYHCWLVGKNRTTIESFRSPTFSYGTDGNGFSLGYGKNWRQVFGDEKKYWLLPVFSSLGDGCSFPTRLVGMDPEQASVPNQSIGSNQPFPTKPLSESKNRLLDSESQWPENGAEESVARAGTNNHVTVAIEN